MTAIALERTSWNLPELARRNWRAGAVVALMAVLFVFAVLGVAKQAVSPRIQLDPPGSPNGIASLRAAVPQTSATALRQIAPESAVQINADIPISNLANPPARPFLLGGSSPADRLRSLDCLTAAIYYEAAREPTEGQRAVAQVVLNRVRHPAYPSTVCGVVFEGARRYTGCQFSLLLRRLAAARPDARLLGAGAGRRRTGAERLCPRPGRAGRPIITPIMSCPTGRRA